MKVSYLKIDKLALQPKSSSPGINTHALLALGIFLAGACLFFFTYRYARLRWMVFCCSLYFLTY